MVKGGYYNKYIKNIFNISEFVAICFQLLPKLFPKLIAWLNTKNYLYPKQRQAPLRKEVYDGNINRTKQNDASSVHHLIILMLQKNEQR